MKQESNNRRLTRKAFLQTTAGVLTVGLFGSKTALLAAPKIPTRSLGRTGLQVTPVCFGTGRTQEPALVRMALDRGVNFFDTGRQYAGGQNEVMLGEALKGQRQNVVLQSKIRLRVRGSMLKSGNAGNIITQQMEQSLHESLQALQTDHIDVLLLHGVSSLELTYHEAVLKFFERAKAEGKIKSHGFSVHNEEMDIIEAAAENPIYDVMMLPYNHRGGFIHSQNGSSSEWDQARLESHLKKLHSAGVGIIAMKTCSGGRFTANNGDEPSYREAVQWVVQRPFIHSANVAMVNYDEVEEDLAALA